LNAQCSSFTSGMVANGICILVLNFIHKIPLGKQLHEQDHLST
jgi:hypothetical protein